jgi:serine/threonine protein kinase/tetratricopeptide (TPR) repeat protein
LAPESQEAIIVQALQEYQLAIDVGQPIARSALLEKYSQVRDELEPCLEGIDLLRCSVPELCSDSIDEGSPVLSATLGDFRILREVGRGGMGVVYEAEQLSIGRRVALKVLPFAAMLDRQQLNRFKNEARAAGTLDHPNIVAIHSVGAERGVHYYAMQLIEGQSLAQVVEQLRQKSIRSPSSVPGLEKDRTMQHAMEKGTTLLFPMDSDLQTPDTAPIAQLSTLPDFSSKEYFRTVAQLGIQAAEALDHAHQNGILHRDIKPANLLVDDTGKLWITDFGLARMEQDAGMTMTGDILGTLRYMSPEQALGKRVVVDHRSDIYSLGVTLYEVLALQPAFNGDDRHQLLRQIAVDEPKPLRDINPRIPDDLQTIVLKAMEKDVVDRYGTAQQMRNDLLAFLQHRPIIARRATLAHRVTKWLRRHRRIALATTAMLLSWTLLLGTGIGWMMRARAARDITAEAAARLALEEGTHLASDFQWQDALRTIERGIEQFTESSGREKLKQRLENLRKDFEMALRLEEAYFERPTLNDQHGARIARSNKEIATVFRKYGIDVFTLTTNQVVNAIARTSIPIELAAALDFWAVREQMHGTKNFDSKRLLSIARAVDQDPWRNRLMEQEGDDQRVSLVGLAASAPIGSLPSTSIVCLAAALHRCGETKRALSLLHLRQQRYPDDFLTNCNLAKLYLDEPRKQAFDQDIRFGTAAVSIRPNSAAALNVLAGALFEKGALDKAVLDEGIVFAKEVVRLEPQEWWAHHNLAAFYHRKGAIEESITCYKESLRLGSTDSMTHQELGSLYEDLRLIDDAIASYSEALRIEPRQHAMNRLGALLRQSHGGNLIDYYRKLLRDEPDLAYAHFGLARELLEKELFDESIENYQSALNLSSTAHPKHIAELRGELGRALSRNNQLDESIACYQQALQLYEMDHFHFSLAHLYTKRRQWPEALKSYEQAVLLAPDSPGVQAGFAWFLATNEEFRDANRAVEHATKAVELEPQNATYQSRLGVAYYRAGKWDVALSALNRARQLRDIDDERDGFFLAMAYQRIGDNKEARKSFDNASDWMEKNASKDEELIHFRAEAERVLGVHIEPHSRHHHTPSDEK